MDELEVLLKNIEDSYFDFVSAVLNYAGKREFRKEKVIAYIKSNPDLKSSDVVRFVSDQPDFLEDAAYMQVG